VIEPGFTFTELVPTWHADTPGSSWIEVSARVRVGAGETGQPRWSRWLVIARWADHDDELHATSVPGEATGEANVVTDTVRVAGRVADAWQLRFGLMAPADAGGPIVSYVGAMASDVATGTAGLDGPTGRLLDRVLAVPTLSQRVHSGHYPRWGGGGDTWCSPTSIAMVLAYWGVGPDPDSLTWVEPGYPDRPVYHAVRHCWDHAYEGAGNWSFNVAYAARFGLDAFVTRLRGLDEAASFIDAGIPLIASLRVDPVELPGSEYTSAGHLMVLAGFTPNGDVVVNDPAAKDLGTLRRVYPRAQFDRAWAAGSGRIVYVVKPPDVPLPQRPIEPNW